MTTNAELKNLIEAARAKGAVILITFDAGVLFGEGREIIETVQIVGGVSKCGPFPMPAITAAERLRGFLAVTP